MSVNPSSRKKIAVFFGGRSPEHDVSVVTGLQVLGAIDPSRFESFPVYITPQGEWLCGDDILRDRASYLLGAEQRKKLRSWSLDPASTQSGSGKARLVSQRRGAFDRGAVIEFDAAVFAFHGLHGEDGGIQGLFDLAGVPYTGMRTKASALLMDKVTTKYVLKGLDIPALPFGVIRRPVDGGYLVDEKQLAAALKDIGFPCIIKPAHMGSSIGVAKCNNMGELRACLPAVFRYDSVAIAEPFVQNLVEYNVAVGRPEGGMVRTSAIERPKTHDELLDFKQKYLGGGDNKSGSKLGSGGTKGAGSPISEGMLSLTRELNPKLKTGQEKDIRRWAALLFEALDGTGAPRIDFISDGKTGEIWMNEVNPCPGSFGYFLWEAAENPVLFTDLLSALIDEAFEEARRMTLPKDPVPEEARLLKR